MKIYIVGAIPERKALRASDGTAESVNANDFYANDTDFESMRQTFASACIALGAAIVRARHNIYIDIPSWDRFRGGVVAVPYIIAGVKGETFSDKPYEIVLYQPKDVEPTDPRTPDIVDTLAELKQPLKDSKIKIEWKQRVYLSDQDFFRNMREADAFILIGGGPGTGLTGQTAAYLGKPVVALTAIGGAAQQSFELVFSSVYRDVTLRDR